MDSASAPPLEEHETVSSDMATGHHHLADVVPPQEIKPFTENQLLSLYSNDFVRLASEFSDEFLAQESGLYFANCPLIELLNEYLRSRLALRSSEDTLKRLKDDLEHKESLAWTLNDCKVENEAVCHDKVKVVSVHRYQTATFNSSAVVACNKLMKETKEESFEHHSLCRYKTSKLKSRIDDYILKICQNAASNRDIVKLSLSVLFSFQRKLINNEIFVQETRSWINHLVAIGLLQNQPSFKDHLFILNHVLRCPGGVGHWASKFVQIPAPVFQSDETFLVDENLKQLVALLTVLFSNVKGRREMLREYCVATTSVSPSSESQDNWTVLDSDGMFVNINLERKCALEFFIDR